DLERDENSDVDPYAENMRIFKEQMKLVDSLQNPDKYIEETNDDVLVPTEQPLEVLNATSISDKFNTIRSNASNEQSIMAIIDDDQNAIAGDRVRIKLLSDIYVGDNLIKKGSYMYAYISGFQTSRVNLMVEQIVYNNRPLRVSLTVYDNDGYMGLYVPSSNFREFTKTLGTQSTRGIGSFQMSQGEDNMAQMGQSLLRRLLSTSGQSLGKLIGRNKVNLKYNYIIYLIDNSKTTNIMKLLLNVLMIFLPILGFSQSVVNKNNIKTYSVRVGQTVHIISPEKISFVDISKTEIDGDLPADNVLRLKINDSIPDPTEPFTVTVVTDDFVQTFQVSPTHRSGLGQENYVIKLQPDEAVSLNTLDKVGQQDFQRLALKIMSEKRRIKNIGTRQYGLEFFVNNIFTFGYYILYDVTLKNNTKLTYQLKDVVFRIVDKKKYKATVTQEIEIKPLFSFYTIDAVKLRNGSWRNVYLFDRFTYPND